MSIVCNLKLHLKSNFLIVYEVLPLQIDFKF